jgi:hypothetical protein
VHQGVLKNIINEYTYSENLTNNKFRAQAKSEIPKYNEDVLTDNDCNYESEITKNIILALDEIKRKLFTDNEMENVQKAINITSMVIFKLLHQIYFKIKTFIPVYVLSAQTT